MKDLNKQDLITHFKTYPLPRCFEPTLLSSIDRSQIVFWDETHIAQEGGMPSRTGVSIRFPRDGNGQLTIDINEDNPVTYNDEPKKQTYKYSQEARFCLGVGIISTGEGCIKGIKAKSFSYTGQTLVTIKNWNKLTSDEYKRINNLRPQSKTCMWISDDRPKDKVYWEEDSLEYLPGLGQTTIDRIKSSSVNEIKTIKQLGAYDVEQLQHIRGIKSLQAKARLAQQGECTYPKIDHRKAENPYLSRYGDTWSQELKKSSALSPYRPITDLIHHIMKESSRLMSGTSHANDWYIMHDALSLMTAKETKQWMRTQTIDGKTYFDRWLIPKNNLNKGTAYHERPVGNSPEFMPLDNSLNNDIKSSHMNHCMVTGHLNDDDVNKFSMKTPRLIERGVCRIWNHEDGPPSSERIIHDINQTFDAFMEVFKAGGAIVPGLCDRNGHRYDTKGTTQHGGKRTKAFDITDQMWLEPHAASVFEDRKDTIKLRYLTAMEDMECDDDEL